MNGDGVLLSANKSVRVACQASAASALHHARPGSVCLPTCISPVWMLERCCCYNYSAVLLNIGCISSAVLLQALYATATAAAISRVVLFTDGL